LICETGKMNFHLMIMNTNVMGSLSILFSHEVWNLDFKESTPLRGAAAPHTPCI
jgi:hypothetical protein